MTTKIKDVETCFSFVELDLIHQYKKNINAEIVRESDKFLELSNDFIRSSFKVTRKEGKKIIKVCHVINDDFEPYESNEPAQLKKILGL
jgi:hypothetical protein